LTCTDKGDFKNSDEQIASFFTLHPLNVTLKKTGHSIWYNIVGKNNLAPNWNFTASYQTAIIPPLINEEKRHAQTSTEIVAYILIDTLRLYQSLYCYI
jgi:hypothetical protein